MASNMALSERDLIAVQAVYPDKRVELRDGKIIIMSPSGDFSEAVAFELAARLREWVRPRKLGFILTSSAGLRLPNGDIVAPDVSFVSKERMRIPPPGFAEVVPELVVEVKSPSDRVAELEEKLALLRSFGTQVVVLVDPEQRTVTVDAVGQPPRILTNADTIDLPALLPGWSTRISELWPEPL